MRRLISRLFGGGRPDERPAAPARSSPPRRDADALLAGPSDHVRAGRRAEAIASLRDLLETHADLAEGHLMLGRLLHDAGELDEARDCYLLASAHRPDSSAAHLQLGFIAIERGEMAEAVASLTTALKLGRHGAKAHNMLGVAHLHVGDAEAAAACFRSALVLDPGLVQAHSNLGHVLFKHLEDYELGEQHIARALELVPDEPAALCNRVMVLQQTGRYDEALALAERLLAEDPSRSEVRMNRALILLARGEFDSAWDDYEARRRMPESRKSADLPWPDWDGSSLADKTIYVYREQGIGDEMMFASCLGELIAQARHCFVECSPKLAPIFRRSFPAATVLLRNEWRKARTIAVDPPDCKAAIGSLPLFLRRSVAAFPAHGGYLRADARRVARWKAKLEALPGRRKVGISWRGGLATSKRAQRSIPLEAWLPILSMPDTDFVSLQYGDVQAELEIVRRAPGVRLTHWQSAVDDYEETAALVAALDLVVSVQTAAVHLAGALGKRVIALIPALPEWRYGASGDSMIWYPSVRLLRQSVPGDWGSVLESLPEEISRCSP
jgi:tetratricopeptide (TPR) repeat protein